MKAKLFSFLVIVVTALVVVLFIFKQTEVDRPELEQINLRLQWIGQTQFAGYIVADALGFYEQVGLDVTIKPAGPDLKPHLTVASGTDDFGVGVSNQIIMARSNSVPLVIVAQFFQDSANRYILKKQNRIEDLEELRSESVGLWLGGDEAEFLAMLASEGLRQEDLNIVPQEFSVIPFLQDEYKLSQVTVYNELIEIESQLGKENIQIISPGEYDAAIAGDMLFTSESMIKNNPEIVEKFVSASIRGWKFALENMEEATRIVVKQYPDLDYEKQLQMLQAVAPLITYEVGEQGVGQLRKSIYEETQNVLLESGQLQRAIDLDKLVWPNYGVEHEG